MEVGSLYSRVPNWPLIEVILSLYSIWTSIWLHTDKSLSRRFFSCSLWISYRTYEFWSIPSNRLNKNYFEKGIRDLELLDRGLKDLHKIFIFGIQRMCDSMSGLPHFKQQFDCLYARFPQYQHKFETNKWLDYPTARGIEIVVVLFHHCAQRFLKPLRHIPTQLWNNVNKTL